MRFTAFCFVFPPFEEENIVFRFPESASRSQLGQESNVLGSISSQLPVLAAASDRTVLLHSHFQVYSTVSTYWIWAVRVESRVRGSSITLRDVFEWG